MIHHSHAYKMSAAYKKNQCFKVVAYYNFCPKKPHKGNFELYVIILICGTIFSIICCMHSVLNYHCRDNGKSIHLYGTIFFIFLGHCAEEDIGLDRGQIHHIQPQINSCTFTCPHSLRARGQICTKCGTLGHDASHATSTTTMSCTSTRRHGNR